MRQAFWLLLTVLAPLIAVVAIVLLNLYPALVLAPIIVGVICSKASWTEMFGAPKGW